MRWFTAVLLSLWATSAWANVVSVGTVDDLKTAISGATQGDEIVLASGTYALTQELVLVGHGTSAAPILVHAADGATAVIQQTSAANDIFSIQNTSYIELRNLTLTGGARAVRLLASDYVTVANCIIHDIGQSAITANDASTAHNYVGLVVASNDIYYFGTAIAGQAGVLLGCTAAGCTVSAPVIASNYIHDTVSAPVGQGDGVLLQPGVAGSDVRDNIVVGVHGRGIAALDAGAQTRNTVERNGIWSTTDVGIDVSGGATIRNNIVIDTTTAGIRAAPAPGSVMNLSIINNSVVVSGTALSVTSAQNAVVLADNALFGLTALEIDSPATAPSVVANVGSGSLVGASGGVATGSSVAQAFVDAKADASTLNAFPRANGPLVGAADASTEATDDFNGTPRGATLDVGAYVFASAGNTGWPLSAGFKSLEPAGGDGASLGGDGDTGGAGGGGTIGGGGASLPIEPVSNSHGCTAVAGSWVVSLLGTIAALRLRQKGPPRR